MTEMALDLQVVKGRSLWKDGYIRLKRNKMAMGCLAIIVFYVVIAVLAKFGWIASPWDATVGERYSPPSSESFKLWLGTDIFGRSVMYKVIHGARIAISVGLISSLVSVIVGTSLGAIAGYFGGWVDDLIVWFYTTISSIPDIILLIAIAYIMGRGITAVYVALSATAWVSLCRIIRGQFIQQKARDYVVAAESLGATHFSRIFKHIVPNVTSFIIINLSIQFVNAIKGEVILSFLGLGVQGQPSWGVMIDDAKLELSRGVWWQLTGATFGMFFVVLALNLFGDALRDALDPKIK